MKADLENKIHPRNAPLVRFPEQGEVGLWLSGFWVYWGGRYSRASIFMRKGERFIRRVIDMAAFGAGVAGLGWLMWVAYEAYTPGFSFWYWIQVPHQELVWFWLSGFADMYVVYRLAQEGRQRRLVLSGVHAADDVSSVSWETVAQLHRRSRVDMASALSHSAERTIERAWLMARRLRHREVRPFHLLAALLVEGDGALVFARLGVPASLLTRHLAPQVRRGSSPAPPSFSLSAQAVLLRAYARAVHEKKPAVRPVDILASLPHEEGIVQEIFREIGIAPKHVEHVAEWLEFHRQFMQRMRRLRHRSSFKPRGEINRSYTAVVTPFLDQFSIDFTRHARRGAFPPMVNRTHELSSVFEAMRAGRRRFALVGEKGTGRTSFMEGIAQLMAAEEVPELLQDKRLVAVSTGALVAGARGHGTVEQRLLGVVSEAARAGNIVLFFDHFQELVGVGSGSSPTLDLAHVLADFLERSNLIVFAAASPAAWKQFIEPSGLSHLFSVVTFNELDFDTTVRVLESKAPWVETKTGALFSYPALEEIVRLTDRYIPGRFLPEKAVSALEEIGVRAVGRRGKGTVVTREDVAEAIAEQTGIPLTEVNSDESKKLLELEVLMHRRVVNQEEAVRAVAAAVRRARTELREEKRPIVNLLFLGPTGVGKTEVAKALAEVYFGSEDSMLRFDMSEYQHEGSVYRLIGEGKGSAGLLTDAVLRNPFSLVLLDEIEKAHPNILHLFLQVMDDGRLTDASGRTVDFTNTMIIATSNAGAFFIQDAVRRGDAIEKIRDTLLQRELREHFRPEFLNRFDNVVVFTPLSLPHVREVAKLMLDRIIVAMAKKEIHFSISQEVVDRLANLGYSPEYGARPLRRIIQEKIENPLSRILLEGRVGRRDAVYVEGDFVWRIEKAKKISPAG